MHPKQSRRNVLIRYKADQFTCDTQDGVLAVGLSNPTGGYVLFQRQLPCELDEAPPYFEFDDQVNGSSKILQSVLLSKNKIIINLLPECATSQFEIKFDISDEQFARSAQCLQQIFSGFDSQLKIQLD